MAPTYFPMVVGKKQQEYTALIGGDWEGICNWLHHHNKNYPSVQTINGECRGGETVADKVVIFLRKIHSYMVSVEDFVRAVNECMPPRPARTVVALLSGVSVAVPESRRKYDVWIVCADYKTAKILMALFDTLHVIFSPIMATFTNNTGWTEVKGNIPMFETTLCFPGSEVRVLVTYTPSPGMCAVMTLLNNLQTAIGELPGLIMMIGTIDSCIPCGDVIVVDRTLTDDKIFDGLMPKMRDLVESMADQTLWWRDMMDRVLPTLVNTSDWRAVCTTYSRKFHVANANCMNDLSEAQRYLKRTRTNKTVTGVENGVETMALYEWVSKLAETARPDVISVKGAVNLILHISPASEGFQPVYASVTAAALGYLLLKTSNEQYGQSSDRLPAAVYCEDKDEFRRTVWRP